MPSVQGRYLDSADDSLNSDLSRRGFIPSFHPEPVDIPPPPPAVIEAPPTPPLSPPHDISTTPEVPEVPQAPKDEPGVNNVPGDPTHRSFRPLEPGGVPHPDTDSGESDSKEVIDQVLEIIEDVIDKVANALNQGSSSTPSPVSTTRANCTVPPSLLSEYQAFQHTCSDAVALSCPTISSPSSLNETWPKCQKSSSTSTSGSSTCQKNIEAACNNLRKWATEKCQLDISSIPTCSQQATTTSSASSSSSTGSTNSTSRTNGTSPTRSSTPTQITPIPTGAASFVTSGPYVWTFWTMALFLSVILV